MAFPWSYKNLKLTYKQLFMESRWHLKFSFSESFGRPQTSAVSSLCHSSYDMPSWICSQIFTLPLSASPSPPRVEVLTVSPHPSGRLTGPAVCKYSIVPDSCHVCAPGPSTVPRTQKEFTEHMGINKYTTQIRESTSPLLEDCSKPAPNQELFFFFFGKNFLLYSRIMVSNANFKMKLDYASWDVTVIHVFADKFKDRIRWRRIEQVEKNDNHLLVLCQLCWWVYFVSWYYTAKMLFTNKEK